MWEAGCVVTPEPDSTNSACGNLGGEGRALDQARRRMGRGWAREGARKQQEQEGSPTVCTMSAPDPGSSGKGRCLEEEESTGEALRAGVGARVSTESINSQEGREKEG